MNSIMASKQLKNRGSNSYVHSIRLVRIDPKISKCY
ncbi:hypothetical protein QR98_0085660 [Sarcoptes scabiei]|uniref:Uncharacterized protein n=1 Tax=Sarcoptes scabiei TaxID=52283 RepID=A0A132AHV2_SARSC|nr:hypothetical protein QR98_0085660 [Sarcoptes scabiei]